MIMVRERSFCLHALGVLLPTTLVHSQLHQKRLTRPTCVNNREHSTILFSHAGCGAMFMELRSVGAWPISNTWYRPFLRAGTCVGCFSWKVMHSSCYEWGCFWETCTMITLTDWKDTILRACRDRLLCYLSNYHWDSSIGAWSRARGTIFTEPLPGELPPLLGCNPKRSSNSSPDGDIPYSPLFLATMLPSCCMAGRCRPYCAIWRAELSYISGIARLRKTECVNNCDCSQMAIHGAISRCQRVGHQGLLNTLASFLSWSPPNAVHHWGCPLASLWCGCCNPGCSLAPKPHVHPAAQRFA